MSSGLHLYFHLHTLNILTYQVSLQIKIRQDLSLQDLHRDPKLERKRQRIRINFVKKKKKRINVLLMVLERQMCKLPSLGFRLRILNKILVESSTRTFVSGTWSLTTRVHPNPVQVYKVDFQPTPNSDLLYFKTNL